MASLPAPTVSSSAGRHCSPKRSASCCSDGSSSTTPAPRPSRSGAAPLPCDQLAAGQDEGQVPLACVGVWVFVVARFRHRREEGRLLAAERAEQRLARRDRVPRVHLCCRRWHSPQPGADLSSPRARIRAVAARAQRRAQRGVVCGPARGRERGAVTQARCGVTRSAACGTPESTSARPLLVRGGGEG
jgi:hypothetical protein